MCIAPKCAVQSHAQNKHSFDELRREEGARCVFILSKGPDAAQAYASPAIGTHRFVNLERYLGEVRTVEQWEFLFQSLGSVETDEDRPTPTDLDVLEVRVAQAQETSKTPMKKRAKLVDYSPRSETGFESTWVPMDPLDTNFEGRPMGVESVVRDIVVNLDTLKAMTDGVRVSQTQFGDRVEEELTEIDLQLASIRRVMGSRPVDMGTLSVFQAVEKLKAQMDRFDPDQLMTGECPRSDAFMRKVIDQAWDPHGGNVQSFKRTLGGEFKETLGPMQVLFSMLSAHQPGDQFQALVRQVQALELKLQGGHQAFGGGFASFGNATGNPSTSGTGVVTGSFAPFANPGEMVADYVKTKLEVANLKLTLKSMEDRLGGGMVKMGGVAFRSWSETSAWLSSNLGQDARYYTLFMDAHGYMALAFQEQSNGSEHVSFKSSVAKAGYDSTQEALISGSFVSELPAFFGWDKKHEALTGDSRVLPGIKKYSDWDSGSSYNGLRFRMAEKITEVTSRLSAQANAVLGPVAANVAIAMITACGHFLNRLSEWITREYTDLVTRGGDKDATWKLISHSVRTLFNDIHQARSFGQDSDDKPDRPGRIMWASLQGHKKMKEYLDENFSRHPKISFILNVHIRDNMISKAQLNKLQEQVAQAVAAANAASSNADRAISMSKSGNRNATFGNKGKNAKKNGNNGANGATGGDATMAEE